MVIRVRIYKLNNITILIDLFLYMITCYLLNCITYIILLLINY